MIFCHLTEAEQAGQKHGNWQYENDDVWYTKQIIFEDDQLWYTFINEFGKIAYHIDEYDNKQEAQNGINQNDTKPAQQVPI